MEGRLMFLALIVAFIKLYVHLTEAATAEETCLLVKDKTYVADPSSCQGWAYCLNGKPIYGKCNAGYLYDSARGICNYADQVACNTNTSTMCTGLSNVYKADPYNCQNYCYCNNGVSYCISCPQGQNYNPDTTSCVWAANSKCVANSPCVLAPNGFIKDASSCDGWIRCGNGQIIDTGKCGTGFNYVASTGLCDYAVNAPCSTSPVAPGTPTIPDKACATPPVDKTADFFVGDGATCRGYFFCLSVSDTAPLWGQCPKNSQFNFLAQQCNDPWVVACPYNRCEGTTKSFVATAYTNCNNYTICTNGVPTGKGNCPTGYGFFNDATGACQTDKLEYEICTAVAPKL